MNFAPYHAFSGCQRLERAVRELHASGHATQELYRDFEIYHFSLVHKLRSARYHVDALKSYLTTQGQAPPAPDEIVYRVNFHLEGFLYLAGSAADIFAREMIFYFGLIPPANVYFHTAHQVIGTNRPGDAILPLIDTPAWRPLFGDYRNTSTHERLIVTGYTIQVDLQGDTPTQRLQFLLPDDARAPIRTYRRNRDLVEYCQGTLRRFLSLFNQAYAQVATRASNGQRLPL